MAYTAQGDNRSPNWGQLAGDITAAAISTSLVSPVITIIDRSLVEKASFNKPILQSLRSYAHVALKNPRNFLFSQPHGHVFTLYAATYTVANSTETITRQTHPSISDAITFVSTFLVNVPLGVWKDIRFAQLFGASSQIDPGRKALPIPKKTGSTAATTTPLVRDAITIYGSFTLAQRCADVIPDSLAAHPYSKIVFTQLVVPLGLDLFNRKYRAPWRDRAAVVWRDLSSATVIRCVRIIPAFGVGCLVNMGLRSVFHEAAG
ncbi:hypothetical protein BDV12DRAFT_189356 [Aspergillus spectabilis]